MSQNSILLDRMRDGHTVTPAQAYELCGTLCAHSRMAELRTQGWPIQCVLLDVGKGKRVGVYSLPETHINRTEASCNT